VARVMLIGDSIRNSYQPLVTTALGAEGHEVWGAPGNSPYTLYTLGALGGWLGAFEHPAVIHWNNGLHDIGHNPKRAPVQMPIEVYAGNLGFIGGELAAAGASVLFATSTPVHHGRPFRNDSWSWRNEEIDAYNAAARLVMTDLRIPINDLHAVVAGDCDGLLSEDQLHLNEAGQQACADAVAAAIRSRL